MAEVKIIYWSGTGNTAAMHRALQMVLQQQVLRQKSSRLRTQVQQISQM